MQANTGLSGLSGLVLSDNNGGMTNKDGQPIGLLLSLTRSGTNSSPQGSSFNFSLQKQSGLLFLLSEEWLM
jgi:uncharacterized protein YigE (DUF2233 family)